MAKTFDLISIGRSSIDLYANDIGVPIPDVKSFAALVGGCPTNISVGTRRLGLKSALMTAVGADDVGEFILKFLRNEGVDVTYTPVKPGTRTSAVILGIQPPDRFPLTYYRDNAADNQLNIDDTLALPMDQTRLIVISGTGLSKEPSRSATLFAAERARAAGVDVFLDIDYRADQWHDPRAFGVTLRAALRLTDMAVGTETELCAAATTDNVDDAIRVALKSGIRALIVKRSERGSSIYYPDGRRIDVPAFPITVLNVLGAGDAFASGFLYGYLHGWELPKAARMGNATGAIVVTRQGCANDMPTEAEALAFIESNGGF